MPTRDTLLQIIDIHSNVAQFGLDLMGVMQHVVTQTLPLSQADGAAIELLEGEELVYRAVAGTALGQSGQRVPVAGSLSGLCLQQGNALVCDDAELDPRVDLAACRRVGLRAMVVIPLKYQATTVGVLKAMSRSPGHFDQEHLRGLELLSKVVGGAMHWASCYGRDDLFRRATHDDLTGLPNRSLFMDRLALALYQAGRQAPAVGVLAVDMDGLKQLNDDLGHAAGDAALVAFARRLHQAARGSDTVARIGGDEFAVLFLPSAAEDALHTTVQRFQRAIDGSFDWQGQPRWLGGSVGGALYPLDGVEPATLLAQADLRMYEAKRWRKQVGGWAASGFGDPLGAPP
jgi:diguanylate cyclase